MKRIQSRLEGWGHLKQFFKLQYKVKRNNSQIGILADCPLRSSRSRASFKEILIALRMPGFLPQEPEAEMLE